MLATPLVGNYPVPPLGAILVLLWVQWSRTPWRDIGYVRPKRGIVLLTAAWFALAHYPEQGLPGVEQALVTGLVFGAIFAVTGRIWIPMFAHAAFDLTALAIIYWNLEFKVAHLIFK